MHKLLMTIPAALLLASCASQVQQDFKVAQNHVAQTPEMATNYPVPQDVTSSVNYTVYVDGTSSFVQRATGQTCFLNEEATADAQFGTIPMGCNLITNPVDAPEAIGKFWVVHRVDGSFVINTTGRDGSKKICEFSSLTEAKEGFELNNEEEFIKKFCPLNLNNTTGETT